MLGNCLKRHQKSVEVVVLVKPFYLYQFSAGDAVPLAQFHQRGGFYRAFQVQVQLRLGQGKNKGTWRGQFVVEGDLLAGAHTRFDLANSLWCRL